MDIEEKLEDEIAPRVSETSKELTSAVLFVKKKPQKSMIARGLMQALTLYLYERTPLISLQSDFQ